MVNVSALGAALASYLFTYFNTKINEERKAQIERVNAQVKDLYGPLLSCVTASRSAFQAMVAQHSPDGSSEGFVRAVRARPEGPEGEAYRKWMEEVLQPLNKKAADTVVEHADMLESSSMEPLLLQLVAHVSAYKVILKRWQEGHIHEWSAVSYPDKLPEYVEQEFRKIKQKQASLLGIKNGAGSFGGVAVAKL